jgi:hypothetical protein
MVDENIIQQIMELRKQGKTIDEISKITGIPRTTVWRIVKGGGEVNFCRSNFIEDGFNRFF